MLVITANVEDEDEEADVLRLNRPETFSIENIIQRGIIPGLFFVYFRLFQTSTQLLQLINVENDSSGMRNWDSTS